jgi:hypothetical protein
MLGLRGTRRSRVTRSPLSPAGCRGAGGHPGNPPSLPAVVPSRGAHPDSLAQSTRTVRCRRWSGAARGSRCRCWSARRSTTVTTRRQRSSSTTSRAGGVGTTTADGVRCLVTASARHGGGLRRPGPRGGLVRATASAHPGQGVGHLPRRGHRLADLVARIPGRLPRMGCRGAERASSGAGAR